MTYHEFLDKCYNIIYSLQDMYLVCSNNVQYNQLESIDAEEKMKLFYNTTEFAISSIRHNLVNIFDSILGRYYVPINRSCSTMGRDRFLTDSVYLCLKEEVCCRKMNSFYYFLKIEKRYDDGTIETETGDDFPFHNIPYKPYNYPEQALIYRALEQEGMLDKEVDEVFIGTYDWNIDTYVM